MVFISFDWTIPAPGNVTSDSKPPSFFKPKASLDIFFVLFVKKHILKMSEVAKPKDNNRFRKDKRRHQLFY